MDNTPLSNLFPGCCYCLSPTDSQPFKFCLIVLSLAVLRRRPSSLYPGASRCHAWCQFYYPLSTPTNALGFVFSIGSWAWLPKPLILTFSGHLILNMCCLRQLLINSWIFCNVSVFCQSDFIKCPRHRLLSTDSKFMIFCVSMIRFGSKGFPYYRKLMLHEIKVWEINVT